MYVRTATPMTKTALSSQQFSSSGSPSSHTSDSQSIVLWFAFSVPEGHIAAVYGRLSHLAGASVVVVVVVVFIDWQKYEAEWIQQLVVDSTGLSSVAVPASKITLSSVS